VAPAYDAYTERFGDELIERIKRRVTGAHGHDGPGGGAPAGGAPPGCARSAPSSALTRPRSAFAMVGVALMAGFTCYQVFMRFVVGQPSTWSEVLVRSIMIWTVYLAAAAAFREGAMIAAEVLVRAVPRPLGKAMQIFAGLLSLVFLSSSSGPASTWWAAPSPDPLRPRDPDLLGLPGPADRRHAGHARRPRAHQRAPGAGRQDPRGHLDTMSEPHRHRA
jgi:hypothetical protein